MSDLRAAPASAQTVEALAAITESDADAAVAKWDQSCTARFRGLLAAEPLTPDMDRSILRNRPRRRTT